MNPIDLGSAYASLEIRLEKLEADSKRAVAIIGKTGANIEAMSTKLNKKLSEDAARAASATTLAQQKALDRQLAQTQAAAKKQSEAMLELAKKTSRAMMLAGGGIAIALGAGVKQAAEFDQAMRNVNSIAHETEAQFQKTSKAVLELTKDPSIRQGPTDLARGMYDVVSSGFSGAKALEILRAGALGASAGMTDTATSTRALMAVLNSGVKGVESISGAMDVLFQEVNLGVNTFSDLANSLGKVLPTAKQAGVSIQEITAAYAEMTRVGIKLDEAETSLNNLLTHIIKPGKESAKVMQALGIEHGIATLRAKGLSGVLEQIITHTHGNAQALVELMPELRAMKGLLVLADEGGRGYNEMLRQMSDKSQVAGAAQRAANEQMKGSVAQYEKAKQRLEVLGIEIGGKLIPVLNRLLDSVSRVADEFNKLPQSTRDTIVQFSAIGGAALFAAGGILGLITRLMELRALLAAGGLAGILGAGTAAGGAVVGLGAFLKRTIGNLPEEGGMSDAVRRQAQRDRARLSGEDQIRRLQYLSQQSLQYRSRLSEIAKYPAADRQRLARQQAERIAEMEALTGEGGTAARTGGIPRLSAAEIAAQKRVGDIVAGVHDKEGAGGGESAARKALREAKERQKEIEQLRADILRGRGEDVGASFAEALQEFYEGRERKLPLSMLTERLRQQAEKAVTEAKRKAEDLRKAALEVRKAGDVLAEDIRQGGADFTTALTGGVPGVYGYERIRRARQQAAGAIPDLNGFISGGLDTLGPIRRQAGVASMADQSRMIDTIASLSQNAEALLKRRFAAIRDSLRNSLGGTIAEEIGYAFVDTFSATLEKAFGKNTFGRAFARAISRWMEKEVGGLLDNLFNQLARKKSGAGGTGGSGLGVLGTILPAFGIGMGLAGLFKGLKFAEGGWVPGPVGKAQPAIVHGGEFVMSRAMIENGGGAGLTVNFHGDNHFASDYDVDRLVDRISWQAKKRLAVNPGTF